MKHKVILSEYQELLGDIRGLLERARAQAYQAVDNIRVQTYWQIGERIAREELKHKERAAYSKQVIKKLASDLGFGRVVLYRILQFYMTYPIVSAVPRQLSWTHFVELLGITDPKERQFYEISAIRNIWSSHELREQIRKKVYSRKVKIIIPRKNLLPVLRAPEEIFKDTYSFDFLKLPDNYCEEELEEALVHNVEKLLLEFGADFSLAGRQKQIIIDKQLHAVDLELYHRGIPCVVLVDLKIGRFKSEYAGKMNKYLNYYRENKKYSWERDPIGLIICEGRGKEEVHYALGNLANRIFVCEYKTKLPSEKDIIERLRKIRNTINELEN